MPRTPSDKIASDLGSSFAVHVRRFLHRFGSTGELRCFFSPGRVNLMGAHLDYNGGPVMPTAVDRGTFIAARARSDGRVRLASTLDDSTLEVDLRGPLPARAGRWFDYPLGALIEMAALARDADRARELRGVDVLFGGNLPVGAGLSSSASICVGTAVCLDALWQLGRARLELVQVALRAERNFVGVRCGIMDPYAVGLAKADHLLWLDCKDASNTYIPLDTRRFAIGIADSLVRRELAQGAFNQRVEECAKAFSVLRRHQPEASCLRDIDKRVFEDHEGELEAPLAKRARHVVHEVERTFAARDALLRGDAAGLGREMTRTHASLRDLFEVSVPELDQLVESASGCEGVLGARLTGAGFGGCAVVLLERGAEQRVADRLRGDFERRFGRVPSVEFYAGDRGPREVTDTLE